MSKKFSKFILSKKLTLCTFPNDAKITTMANLRSENILMTFKYNVYKTNRQSLFHKKMFLVGPFILEIEECMCFFILSKIFVSEFFYPYMKSKSVKHAKIITFIEAKIFVHPFLFEIELSMSGKIPGIERSISKRKGRTKIFASMKVDIWAFFTLFNFIKG